MNNGIERNWNVAFLVATTLAAVPYAAIPWLSGLLGPGAEAPPPRTWLMVLVWAAPLSYLWLLWRRRHVMIPFDYLMFVAPLVVWLVLSIILKVLLWEITNGKPVFGPYGADKGLSNAIIEPTVVLALSGVYLFGIPRAAQNARDAVLSRKLLLLSVSLAALVAILVPPLPD